MSLPTKTVSKRSIFDLIPHKVTILMRGAAPHQKMKERKVFPVRTKYKKVSLKNLIRMAFRSHFSQRRPKEHKRTTILDTIATTAYNHDTTTTVTTTTAATSATATATSDWRSLS